MMWSKRRKKFNKTFDVLKHHRYLIDLATAKLISASIAAKLDYHIVYGYPPCEDAPKFVYPENVKILEERLLDLIYG